MSLNLIKFVPNEEIWNMANMAKLNRPDYLVLLQMLSSGIQFTMEQLLDRFPEIRKNLKTGKSYGQALGYVKFMLLQINSIHDAKTDYFLKPTDIDNDDNRHLVEVILHIASAIPDLSVNRYLDHNTIRFSRRYPSELKIAFSSTL